MGVLPPFQTLVDAHWYDVARLAQALMGPQARDEGADVAQQAWLQAYAAYPGLTSATNLRGWLLTITHRCAMDAHRGRARRPLPAGDGVTDAVEAQSTDPPQPVTTDVWARAARLPERQRSVLALRFVADLDHAAIARELDISPALSRRVLSDALAALREDLT